LMPAANALVTDQHNYRLTSRCMWAINALLTAVTAVVTLITPAYYGVFVSIMRFPPEVAEAARPALCLLLLWPGMIGIRRYYNGILVRFGWTAIIGWATAARVVVMIAVTTLGIRWFPQSGVLIGGAALMLGVFVDTAAAVVAAGMLLREEGLPAVSEDSPAGGRSVLGFVRFFVPLALTSTLRVIARPLMLSGIARGTAPVLSMAAFPVALGTMSLAAGQLQMLQQVVVARVTDAASHRLVRRFTQLVSFGCTGALLLVTMTPLSDLYHGGVIGLRGDVLAAVNGSLALLAVVPLLTGLQAYNQGLLIRSGKTVAVNAAALLNLLILVGSINVAVARTQFAGYLVAGAIMPAALLIEVGLLSWCARPSVARIRGEYREAPGSEVSRASGVGEARDCPGRSLFVKGLKRDETDAGHCQLLQHDEREGPGAPD
ncbi:MAG: hypothetical protein R6U70_04910, partial [Bacillota bacterium]